MSIEWIVIIVFCCGIIAGMLGMRVYNDSFTKNILTEFMKRFPGRCPICSYHKYGIRYGYLSPDEPVTKHDCPEGKEKSHG